jgi:hypothetical protein
MTQWTIPNGCRDARQFRRAENPVLTRDAAWHLSGRLIPWSMDSLRSSRASTRAGNGSVKNALNSAQGQADHAYTDAGGSGLTESEAVRGLRRYLGASPGRMRFIRIVGGGFAITWP